MLTKEDLEKFIYDPNITQATILDYINKASDGELTIVDPTNPFNMLLEASAISAANAVISMKSTLQKLYPNLATDKADLYHHLSDDQLVNMFATPSKAKIVFYLNTIEFKQYGYRAPDSNYVTVIIPENTEVTVAETTFTLLNDVSIRLYDDGTIFSEQLVSDNDLAENSSTILNSTIVSDSESVSWVLVEVTLPQITRYVLKDTITIGESYNHDMVLNDQYVYSTVSYKNNNTNNEYIKLNKTHSEEFIDPYVPTVFISNTDETVTYNIPDVYILSDQVSGNLEIVQYESKGKLYLPINNYTVNDYKIKLGNTGKTVASSVLPNITILANSGYPVDGGLDAMPMSKLKESIINNVTGDIDLPITEFDIKQKAMYEGFEIFKVLDVITDRAYIATKNLPKVESELIHSRADIFFNTVSFILSDLNATSNILITDDYFIIRSGSVFKETNGKVEILNDYDIDELNALTLDERVVYYVDKKYYYTPYYYIIDKIDTVINSRIYELDHPSIEDIVVKSKNSNVVNTIAIETINIEKISTGYEIKITLNSDGVMGELAQNSLYVQLEIPLANGSASLYYNEQYNLVNNEVIFNIATDFYINKDNNLNILNGYSTLSNKDILLKNIMNIYIYTTDISFLDENNFLIADIAENRSDVKAVFIKESANLTFGNELKYIWNKVSNSYTERKYLKYDKDVPLLYEEDVYEKDPITGAIFTVTDTNGDGSYDTIDYNIRYHKGDQVVDSDGNLVYVHKAGDIVLTDDNIPVVDQGAGVVRYIDIFMIEYEYKLATTNPYKNYLVLINDVVREWLLDTMVRFNDITLENTSIIYKSYKNNQQVKIAVNDVLYSIPYAVSPTIDLYVTRDDYTGDEVLNMEFIIGTILHEALDDTTISQTAIRENIIAKLGNDVVGVKISGLDNIGDLEVFTLTDKTTRLVLDKKLFMNKDNDLVVTYNILLNMHKV